MTGHTLSSDTILVGETAPEGSVTPVAIGGRQRYNSNTGFYDAMTPMIFVRSLYCVSSSYRRLTGAAASAVGCPRGGSTQAFVNRHPGLFYATGLRPPSLLLHLRAQLQLSGLQLRSTL